MPSAGRPASQPSLGVLPSHAEGGHVAQDGGIGEGGGLEDAAPRRGAAEIRRSPRNQKIYGHEKRYGAARRGGDTARVSDVSLPRRSKRPRGAVRTPYRAAEMRRGAQNDLAAHDDEGRSARTHAHAPDKNALARGLAP